MRPTDGGIVAVLLTDVAGSTSLWQRDAQEMEAAMKLLDADVRRAADERDGTVLTTRGEGDSHFVVFGRATDAAAAGVAIQHRRTRPPWLDVRAGIHVVEVSTSGDGLALPASYTARVRAAAHGGQTICTRVVADLAADVEGVVFKPLGHHRLRDFRAPVELFQVEDALTSVNFPPPITPDRAATPVMTVVALDQIGSFDSAPRSAEALTEWQRRLLTLFRAEARNHDGRHLKFTGDGCLVAFDDPRRALAFARLLCGRPELRLCGAVAAGMVEEVEGELTGFAFFEACRHLRGLSAGETWVSPVVRELIGGPE